MSDMATMLGLLFAYCFFWIVVLSPVWLPVLFLIWFVKGDAMSDMACARWFAIGFFCGMIAVPMICIAIGLLQYAHQSGRW